MPFNVAIDRKPRGRDLVKLAATDSVKDNRLRERASEIQSKNQENRFNSKTTENTLDAIIE